MQMGEVQEPSLLGTEQHHAPHRAAWLSPAHPGADGAMEEQPVALGRAYLLPGLRREQLNYISRRQRKHSIHFSPSLGF